MFNSMKNRASALLALVVGMVAAPTFAALPAVIGTEITAMQTDALAAIDLVWPFLLAVLGGFVILKIVKRVINKV